MWSMKQKDKQFLIELRELLDKYDMTIGFNCEGVESIYGEHIEICRRSDDETIFETDEGEWMIGAFNLPKE